MKYKLAESISEKSKITYDFVGFDDWRDFIKIMNIVKDKIKPNKSNYQGITDMNGFFEKDGLYVEVQYDEMIGNYLELKWDQTDLEAQSLFLFQIKSVQAMISPL